MQNLADYNDDISLFSAVVAPTSSYSHQHSCFRQCENLVEMDGSPNQERCRSMSGLSLAADSPQIKENLLGIDQIKNFLYFRRTSSEMETTSAHQGKSATTSLPSLSQGVTGPQATQRVYPSADLPSSTKSDSVISSFNDFDFSAYGSL